MERISRREFLGLSKALSALLLPQELWSFPLVRAAHNRKELNPESPPFYFEETGHNLKGRFLDYWRRHGNGLLLGLPITEEIGEDGKTIQYFENARVEWHPQNTGTKYEILLGLLGEELVAKDLRSLGEPSLNNEFFEKYGGIDFFGYPISKPWREGNKTYQFTQRFLVVRQDDPEVPPQLRQSHRLYKANRGHYHRLLWPGEIYIESLGKAVAQQKGIDTKPKEQYPNAVLYDPSWKDHEKQIEVSIKDQTLIAYEGELPVFEAQVSTGTPGFDTPRGVFPILEKRITERYRSPFPWRRNYDLHAVPFNLRLTLDGIYIHGIYWHNNLGRRMSAGCINLNIDDAWWLYQWSRTGTEVVIK